MSAYWIYAPGQKARCIAFERWLWWRRAASMPPDPVLKWDWED